MEETRSRLGSTFQRAILVALAGIGCGTKAADAVDTMQDAGVDASTVEAGVVPDAGKEAGPVDKCAPIPYQPTPPDTCGSYYKYPCGVPAGYLVRGDCYFGVNDCAALCPDVHFNCHAIEGYCDVDAGDDAAPAIDGKVVPDEAGAVIIDCSTCLGSAGRVPAGLAREAVRAPSLLGAYFASAARLEAASVTAFRRLHDELEAHGAPRELLDATRAAEHDEVRHTRAMARLARRHGARYTRPRVDEVAPRSLETIARENAVEGCARETFGALLATWQASRIDDPELAETLRTIAEDETRHAALSWSIARWSLSQLDADACARMESEWRAALTTLAGDDVPHIEGIAFPSNAQRAALAGELRPLWTTLLAAA